MEKFSADLRRLVQLSLNHKGEIFRFFLWMYLAIFIIAMVVAVSFKLAS